MIKKLIMSSMILASALSCSKGQEGDLSVQVVGSSAYLIDSSAQSCSNIVAVSVSPSTVTPTDDVSSNYFSYHGLTLNWKNLTDTLFIVKIDFDFTSANFTQSCTVSGDELLALFYDFTGKKAWDGTLAPAADATNPTTKSTASLCQIRCGGLTVADPKKAFTAAGIMTVKGFQRGPAPDYEEKPVKAQAPVRLMYSP